MRTPSRRRGPRGDLILIAALVFLSVALLAAHRANRSDGGGVIVAVGGVEAGRYPFRQTGVYELNGGTNTLVIADGAAWLSAAKCPDGLCVRQGKIRYSGQCITCLPNRLTVTVYGADGGVELVG